MQNNCAKFICCATDFKEDHSKHNYSSTDVPVFQSTKSRSIVTSRQTVKTLMPMQMDIRLAIIIFITHILAYLIIIITH